MLLTVGLAHLKGLYHVRVSAHYMVHALRKHPVGQLLLFFAGGTHVFYAPVGQRYNHVALQQLGDGDVSRYLGRVDVVHVERLGNGQPVRAVGEAEQRYPYVVLLYNQWVLGVAGRLVLVGAQMGHMAGVHLVDGARQTCGTLVAAVVVGCGQHVETGMQNGVEIGGGSAEAGIAGVGWGSQCGLEIGYRQVGLLHGGFHQTEYVVEIVLATAHMAAVQLGHVHHHVAAYEQRHFAHTVFQGGLGCRGLCGGRFLGAAAA